jgi:hypothetical protein
VNPARPAFEWNRRRSVPGWAKRTPSDGDSDRPLWQGPGMVQEPLLLAGSIAGLVAAVGVAVLLAVALSMRRDCKRLKASLKWHDESLAETPPVHEPQPLPATEDADRPLITA